MASPASKKPILTIKRESLFKYTPVIISPVKRPLANVQPGPSAKKTCLEVSIPPTIVETSVIVEAKTATAEKDINNSNKKLRSNSPSYSIVVPADSGTKFTSNVQISRCQKHEELPEHNAEGLPQFGDTFNSPEEFYDYTTKNAQNWLFYYVRQDCCNLKTSPHYNKFKATTVMFACRFNTKKYKSQSKGLRKRSEKQAISCPAGVNLKCDVGKDVYRVYTVCHHHRHELSAELFKQLPHGYRLPQELKDEIQDLAHFNLDPVIARRYIESKTSGLSLRKTIYNTFVKIRNSQTKHAMSPERVQEMLEKIKYIKANFSDNLPNKPRYTAQKAENSFKLATPRKCAEIINDQEILRSVNELKATCEVETNPCLGITQNFDNFDAEYHEEYQPTEIIVQTSVDENESTAITETSLAINAPFKDYKIGEVNLKSPETDYNETVHTYKVFIGAKSKKKLDKSSMNQLSKLDQTDTDLAKDENHEMTSSSKNKCDKRHEYLPEHDAVGLVQVGDTFSSMEEFARYAAAHSLNWFFYYQVAHSRNVKTTERYNPKRKTWYNFTCRFNKGWYKSQSTGARKVKQKSIFCPAMVNMTCNPGEDAFRVVYVCHHHSHELSYEVFSQEAHGHRLPPELKDEIRELAWFQLDRRLMRAYFMHKTGFDLRPTIKNVLSKMRRNREKIVITPEKESEILDKIREIKIKFDIPKRAPPRSTNQRIQYEDNFSDSEEEGVASRVEARLNNILYDRELIQSVKELQEITGCEIHIDPGDDRDTVKDVSHLQSGLVEETNYESQVTDQYADGNEYDDGDGQIEIDQEVYPMDENIYYIPDPTQMGDEILHIQANNSHGLTNTTEQCEENPLYLQDTAEIIGENIVTVNSEDHCDNVQYEVHIEEQEVIVEQENTQYNDRSRDMLTETDYTVENTNNKNVAESVYQYSNNISYIKNETEFTVDNKDIHHDNINESRNVYEYSNNNSNIVNETGCTAVDNNDVEYNEIKNDSQNVCEYSNNNSNIDNETECTVVNNVECYDNENIYKDASYNPNIENEIECSAVDDSLCENVYQHVYINNNSNIENEIECAAVDNNIREHISVNEERSDYYELKNTKESIYCKDIGVQADFEIIALEADSEIIKKMESKFLSDDLAASNFSVTTRGKPKVILDEGIINKYNIEFYMSIGGVAICIENLSLNMGWSVIELLKKIYQGEAVLKMTSGRSGKVFRKTVQLTYVPVTVSFPLENTKYINGLQEYKTICSKYSDLVIKLEETIESMSTELKETKKKVENIGSQQIIEVTKNYENLKKAYKESQEDLSKTQAENKVLLEKLNKLESIEMQKVLEPKLDVKKSTKLTRQSFLKAEQELEKVSSENIKLIEKIKGLEEMAMQSAADIKHYQEKINKLEDLYLTDSQSLLDKIKMLQEELHSLVKSGGKPSSSLKEYFEEYKLSENEDLMDKIKALEEKIASLKSQLEEEKNKNVSVKNHNYASKTKKLALGKKKS